MWPSSFLFLSIKVSHKCLGAGSSGGRAHPDKGEVARSSRARPTIFHGGLAQLGERLICIQEVSGSIPLSSTNFDTFSFFKL